MEQFRQDEQGRDMRPDAKPLSKPRTIHDTPEDLLGPSLHPPRNRAQEAQPVILEEGAANSRTMATITSARFAAS